MFKCDLSLPDPQCEPLAVGILVVLVKAANSLKIKWLEVNRSSNVFIFHILSLIKRCIQKSTSPSAVCSDKLWENGRRNSWIILSCLREDLTWARTTSNARRRHTTVDLIDRVLCEPAVKRVYGELTCRLSSGIDRKMKQLSIRKTVTFSDL